jgi:hypothetical protein
MIPDGMQLLRNRGSTLGELHAQLSEILFHERHTNVLSAQVTWIPRPWDLVDRQHAARGLFLNP